jgi:hypothetical protein
MTRKENPIGSESHDEVRHELTLRWHVVGFARTALEERGVKEKPPAAAIRQRSCHDADKEKWNSSHRGRRPN